MFNLCTLLTGVVVCEGSYKLLVLLHEGGLVHHCGAGGWHEGHCAGGERHVELGLGGRQTSALGSLRTHVSWIKEES